MNIDLNNQKTQQQKKNKIWSNVVQEQLLCDDLLQSFNVETLSEKRKDGVSVDRTVESYLKESDVQRNNKPNPKSNDNNSNKKQKKRSRKKNKNKNKNNNNNNDYLKSINKSTLNQMNGDLVRTKSLSSSSNDLTTCEIKYDETKSRSHILANELDSDEIVCKEIVRQLNERKSDLIMRCVKTLGKKKCLELLYATEDIEECGGMYSEENRRRRSPGGVFIQLIKRDEQILSSQRKIIFALQPEEKKFKNKLKKKFRKNNRPLKEKNKNNESKQQNDSKNVSENQEGSGASADVLPSNKNEAPMET